MPLQAGQLRVKNTDVGHELLRGLSRSDALECAGADGWFTCESMADMNPTTADRPSRLFDMSSIRPRVAEIGRL